MTSPSPGNVREQIEAHRARLVSLVRRGQDVRDALAADAGNASALTAARVWQQDCGVVVNELSGGSKAHWLAQAFSQAFLVRGTEGSTVETAAPSEIVQRLIGVLELALASLSREDSAELLPSPPAAPHRFDFVHEPELRPILEQAYHDARAAIEGGDYDLALRTYASILEAIVTDALQESAKSGRPSSDLPDGDIAGWTFEERLTVAEKIGLIGRGCARLPATARNYRELDEASKAAITERDARLTSQVLHVILRDLNPGR